MDGRLTSTKDLAFGMFTSYVLIYTYIYIFIFDLCCIFALFEMYVELWSSVSCAVEVHAYVDMCRNTGNLPTLLPC